MVHDSSNGIRRTSEGRPLLVGLDLRYVLASFLRRHGRATVADLVAHVETLGFGVVGRPSKAVSDALRWEVARGRAVRLDRGLYGPGRTPTSTAYRIDARVRWLTSLGDRAAA